jgi:hypothetical protein
MYPFMCTPFLTLAVSTAQDVVRIRQLTRQAAALLGFEIREQTCLAAAAFDLAGQAQLPTGRARVTFSLHEAVFRIHCTAEAPATRRARWETQDRACEDRPLLLEKSLPPSQRRVVQTDLTWMLEQVMALSSPDPFEELQTANRELLRALLDLAAQQAKPVEGTAATKKEPDAA